MRSGVNIEDESNMGKSKRRHRGFDKATQTMASPRRVSVTPDTMPLGIGSIADSDAIIGRPSTSGDMRRIGSRATMRGGSFSELPSPLGSPNASPKQNGSSRKTLRAAALSRAQGAALT